MTFWNRKIKKADQGRRTLVPAWGIGLFIGILCLIAGAFENQFKDIMQKAVMICLECIGIG